MGAHTSQNLHHARLTLMTLGTLFSTFVTPLEKESSHRRQTYSESIHAGEDSPLPWRITDAFGAQR